MYGHSSFCTDFSSGVWGKKQQQKNQLLPNAGFWVSKLFWQIWAKLRKLQQTTSRNLKTTDFLVGCIFCLAKWIRDHTVAPGLFFSFVNLFMSWTHKQKDKWKLSFLLCCPHYQHANKGTLPECENVYSATLNTRTQRLSRIKRHTKERHFLHCHNLSRHTTSV